MFSKLREKTFEIKNYEKRNLILFVFFILSLIAIDQVAKYFVKTFFLNYNFAFSLPVPTSLIYFIYTLVIAGMVYYVKKYYLQFSLLSSLAWCLIFAGAISNILERLIFGYVKDFIYLNLGQFVGIYNLADFYIIAGIIILILMPKSQN
jgi:signal peptidase II